MGESGEEKKTEVPIGDFFVTLLTSFLSMRMYDVSAKLLNRIKSMYVNSLTFIRVKGNDCVSELLTVK